MINQTRGNHACSSSTETEKRAPIEVKRFWRDLTSQGMVVGHDSLSLMPTNSGPGDQRSEGGGSETPGVWEDRMASANTTSTAKPKLTISSPGKNLPCITNSRSAQRRDRSLAALVAFHLLVAAHLAAARLVATHLAAAHLVAT